MRNSYTLIETKAMGISSNEERGSNEVSRTRRVR